MARDTDRLDEAGWLRIQSRYVAVYPEADKAELDRLWRAFVAFWEDSKEATLKQATERALQRRA
jgi:hypothetical protein